jgi:hypothetical protein
MSRLRARTLRVGAALQSLGGQFAEPAFDEVEPGTAYRGEVRDEARMRGQIDLLGAQQRYAYNRPTLSRIEELARRAEQLEISTAGLALARLQWYPVVTSPLVSPRTSSQ